MPENKIKLGLMPPMTGIVEMYGQEIIWAAQIACQEINDSGGVLGKQLELIIEDDGSLPDSAVRAAEKLIDQDRCVAIIGNLLSNSRIAVAYHVAEARKIPLLNFSFYEGSILSRYFFHFAALPNQQICQMIPYMKDNFGSKMFFAGNNYEWPRGSIDAAKKTLVYSGGQVVGEEYLPIGTSQESLNELLDHLEQSAADVFVPYFAGSDQVNLLTLFSKRGLKNKITIVMGHYDEVMASHLPTDVRGGFYSSNTYFMTIESSENDNYKKKLAALPGVEGVWPNGNGILTNFGEGAYLCVKAFALAANKAGSTESDALIKSLENIKLIGPQGSVEMDAELHHAKVNSYLSCCQSDGSFRIIKKFGAIAPVLPERYRHLKISTKSILDDDLRLQSRIVEQMSEAVFLINSTDTTIIYANPACQTLFGYLPEEVLKKPFTKLHVPKSNNLDISAEEINKILYQKGSWSGEINNLRKNGSTFWSSTSIAAFTHDRHGEVWLAIYRDISERKKYEEELTLAKEMAEAAAQAKGQFLANMSHEIRTPMNAIIGMAELLSETTLSETQEKYIKIFKKAGENLLHLINDILEISKMDAESLVIENEEINLQALLTEVIEMNFLKAHDKRLNLSSHFHLNTPKYVIGDSMRIKQVLMNLIGNAIKFTNQGTITVSIGANNDKTRKGNLYFSVADTGIGIASEQIPKLFNAFSQADVSTTKKYGGTGLGLVICKKLVRLMGGEIYLNSTPGAGSIFSFTLSCKEIEKKDPVNVVSTEQPKEKIKTLPNFKILSVDDSEINQILIKEYLRKFNCQLFEAENGLIAVEMAKSEKFDVILMDMQMPILDGYEATKKIREWEAMTGHHTLIIAITAYAMKGDQEKSIAAGCDHHLSKPIKKNELLSIISTAS